MGANPAATVKAFNEAENYDGPALIVAYARRPLRSASPLLRNLPYELRSSVHLH
jgi:pyruvate-ferredoxin/flavodoxin oxidoreductase